jgi:hypothetical protein
MARNPRKVLQKAQNNQIIIFAVVIKIKRMSTMETNTQNFTHGYALDGNFFQIEISDDKKRKINWVKDSPESEVDRVAEGIREWLKQKRVDR